MTTHIHATAPDADAITHALSDTAKAANLQQIAALADIASEAQVAEHIEAMVALTMAHLPPDASAAARERAAQWQRWALGIADGVAQGTPLADLATP